MSRRMRSLIPLNTTRDSAAINENEERYSIGKDGYANYVYRVDPTNTYMGKYLLQPQEFAFGFLNDTSLWEISDEVDYVGRDCVVITGKTEKNYGEKVNVTDFTLYLDKNTGCMLKLIGLDKNGNISKYLITEKIEFDLPIENVTMPDLGDCTFVEN